MSDIQIPCEAVEAAAREYAYCAGYTWGSSGLDHDAIRNDAKTIILAGLKAWPGNRMETEYFTHCGDYWEPAVILPMPQEAGDDHHD